MKKWLIKNGLNIAWVIMVLYALATFAKAKFPILPIIACAFFLLYGLMSVILFEFHKNRRRLILQLFIVIGAIIFKIADSINHFNVILSIASFSFFVLIFVDSLTLNKIINRNENKSNIS